MLALYIKRASKGLSVSYPKLIHVTCVAGALHRVYETIPVLYPSVDKLVTAGKKIFVKLPARIEILQDIFQDSNELKVLRTDLAYIRANFSFLSQSITELEMTTNLLSETTTLKIN
jgi:hypothetical protein